MSYQPPPPPPGAPPAGAPGSTPGFDPKTVNPLDWGILGAGVLAFIFSLFDYYTVTISLGPISRSGSVSAWHGFFGWFAALLALAGAALVAIELFQPQISLPFAARLGGLGLFAVSTVCVIIALFVFPDGGAGQETIQIGSGGLHIDEGRGFGYWASLIVIIAGAVLSLMRLQATGGQLPGGLQGRVPNIGGYGPQGGIGGAPSGAPQAAHPSSAPYAPPPPAPPRQDDPPPAGPSTTG